MYQFESSANSTIHSFLLPCNPNCILRCGTASRLCHLFLLESLNGFPEADENRGLDVAGGSGCIGLYGYCAHKIAGPWRRVVLTDNVTTLVYCLSDQRT